MKMAPPKTPQEIRDLLRTDPSQITDQHLLALILARGSTRRRPGRPMKSWKTIALAEDLYQAAGGRLADLVERTSANTIDLSPFGIGESIGGRLVASMDLAHRWRCGFNDRGDGRIRCDDQTELRKRVFHRQGKTSEADLFAVILGATYPDTEEALHLLHEFVDPQNLMTSLALDVFESFRKDNVLHVRLPKAKAEIELSSFCRLFAAVELAQRYCLQTGPKPVPLEIGTFGLQSAELVRLLDPSSSLELEFRSGMIEVLRSHPQLAGDFAKLDVLTRDAQVESYHRAIELCLAFEELRKRRTWSHPSELLGENVPYGALLAIADARIERASRRPVRIVKVKELLERAQQAALARPIDSFVEALLALRISKAAVKKAIEKGTRRYLKRAE